MTTPGLRIDQVADAFVSVPGTTIEMINMGCVATRTTTSASFIGIGVPTVGEPGDIINTFVVPVAGMYLLDLDLQTAGTGNYGFYRLVFDYDGTPIYVGGDLTWRRTFYNGFILGYHFKGLVTLTAGTHTVKLEWKVEAGSLAMYTDAAASALTLRGTLVTGSGASGTIGAPVESSVGSPQTISSSPPTYTDLTDLTKTVTTAANETVIVSVAGTARASSGATQVIVAVLLDGNIEHQVEQYITITNGTANVSFTVALVVASAGSHIIKVAGAKETAGSDWQVISTPISPHTPADGWKFEVLQFRGGLVPIQQEGTSVVDTPKAINFKGPVTVTLTSGAADVQVLGNIQDLTSSVPFMTANDAPSGTASASSEYGSSPAWKAFDAAISGWLTNGGGAPGWLQYQFTTAKTILSYSIIGWSNDTYPDRLITAWTLQGSNNGSDFTVLDTRTKLWRIGFVAWQPQLFTVATPGSYAYYRLNITANYGGNAYVGIAHLALYEF